jgi:hypothetical protein
MVTNAAFPVMSPARASGTHVNLTAPALPLQLFTATERAFHEVMIGVWHAGKRFWKSGPRSLIELIGQYGAVNAAKLLLRDAAWLEVGLVNYIAEDHPEACVEAQVGDVRWRELFTRRDVSVALDKLRRFGHVPPWANLPRPPEADELTCILRRRFEAVDLRPSGRLWVVAGPQWRDYFGALVDRPSEFKEAPHGGKAVGHRPAFWLKDV